MSEISLTAEQLAKPFDGAGFTYDGKWFCKSCLHHDFCHYKDGNMTRCATAACAGKVCKVDRS